MKRLMQEIGVTAHLGIMQQNEVVSLVNIETQRSVRTPSMVGRRSPLHCTSLGKVMLAYMPRPQVVQVLHGYCFVAYTNRTIRDESTFRTELTKVQKLGFALDDEEFETGLRCIGVPVHDHTGKVIAGLSIAGPLFRITTELTPMLVQSVVHVAEDLCVTLGYNQDLH